MFSSLRLLLLVGLLGLVGDWLTTSAVGHDPTRPKAEQQQLALQQKAASLAETPPQPNDPAISPSHSHSPIA